MPATGACLRMPGPAATNVRVHVHAAREIDCLGQIAMLAEELAERDPLAQGRRVELIRRLEHDDDVAAAAGMERVAAVDVAQLLLEHDLEHDLRARVGRVAQRVEGVDDLGPGLRVGRRRRPGGRVVQGSRVDVDLGRSAGPTGLGDVDGTRTRCQPDSC